MTPDQIHQYLPDAPPGYHYSVEQVSKLIQKVWLHHEYDYVYAEGDPVKTVYCFVKGDKVHPPKDHKQARPRSVTTLVDLHTMSPYTTVVPTTTDLTHIK